MKLDSEDSQFCQLTSLSEEDFVSAVGGASRYVVFQSRRSMLRTAGFEILPLPLNFSAEDVATMDTGVDVKDWAKQQIGQQILAVETAHVQSQEQLATKAIMAAASRIIADSKGTLAADANTIATGAIDKLQGEADRILAKSARKFQSDCETGIAEIRTLRDEVQAIIRRRG